MYIKTGFKKHKAYMTIMRLEYTVDVIKMQVRKIKTKDRPVAQTQLYTVMSLTVHSAETDTKLHVFL